MVEVRKQKTASKKKGFYEVEAPLTAQKIHLYGSSLEEFDGRIITLDLTRSLRGRSLELKMRVNLVNGKLKATPIIAVLVGSYIRRMMRRGIDYVEDSFEIDCRDSVSKIKPFLITRNRVSRAVRNALRINAKKYIEGHVKIRTAKEIFSDIITGKLQKGMSARLKKIYPLALCEIRMFEIRRVKEEKREEEEKNE